MSMTNSMVAHVWAQQNKQSGRSSNGNFSFSGNTLYSYSTPIARMVTAKDGSKIALFTNRKYSATTSGKHMSPAFHAVGHLRSYSVPDIYEDHGKNIKYLEDNYRTVVSTLMRANNLSDWCLSQIESQYSAVVSYAEHFGLDAPKIDLDADWRKIKAAYAERNTPEKIAKREAEAEKRRVRKEKQWAEEQKRKAEEDAERLPKWRAGENIRAPYSPDGSAYLRVMGEELHTSLGARVPLDHAIRAFQLIKACRTKRHSWEENGHSIHVGHFAIRSISQDGNIIAGCHRINWPEIELIARQIGIYDAD